MANMLSIEAKQPIEGLHGPTRKVQFGERDFRMGTCIWAHPQQQKANITPSFSELAGGGKSANCKASSYFGKTWQCQYNGKGLPQQTASQFAIILFEIFCTFLFTFHLSLSNFTLSNCNSYSTTTQLRCRWIIFENVLQTRKNHTPPQWNCDKVKRKIIAAPLCSSWRLNMLDPVLWNWILLFLCEQRWRSIKNDCIWFFAFHKYHITPLLCTPCFKP